ncbi:unnamed protein product, partial [Prorocentrum cordatum]
MDSKVKYLGMRIGPRCASLSWRGPFEKHLERAHIESGLDIGFLLTMQLYNAFIASVLCFVGQLDAFPHEFAGLEKEARAIRFGGAEGGSAGSRSGAPREAASATAGGLVQTKPNDPWAWSTGHAAYYAQVKDKASDKKRRGASRSRSRRGDARGDAAPAGPPRGSRSRSRGGEAERRRDRSRSRGRRRRDRSEKRQRDVEVEGPSDRGLFRVNCVFGVGLSIGRTMTATGPWRTSREGAEADGERLRAAYYQGGPSTLTAVKNALYADEKSGG